ncbi:unnamed protein product [Phaeothamnion confervicola]
MSSRNRTAVMAAAAVITTDDATGFARPAAVAAAACGWQCFAVATAAGQLQTWGLAEEGRLGHGTDADLGRPAPVAALRSQVVVALACGRGHMLAVTDTGALFAWGDNRCGQLGIGKVGGMAPLPRRVAIRAVQTADDGVSGGDDGGGSGGGDGSNGNGDARVAAVACGGQHSLALGTDGVVYTWGRARWGQLGRVPEAAQARDYGRPAPVRADFQDRLLDLPAAAAGTGAQMLEPLPPQPPAAALAGGARISLGGGSGKSPDGCGSGGDGGSSSGGRNGTPSRGRVRAIAAGWGHSVAATERGSVFAWGCGGRGRLGLGSHADAPYPQQVRALAAAPLAVVDVAAGYAHTLFLTASGAVFACGDDRYGQVGAGAASSGDSSDGGGRIGWKSGGGKRGDRGNDPDGGNSAGNDNGNDGGGGGNGGGGNGGGNDVGNDGGNSGGNDDDGCGGDHGSRHGDDAVLVPRRVAGLAGRRVRAVSAGERHSAAVLEQSNANVFSWGANSADQCALGATVSTQRTPREAEALSGARRVVCGGASTLVVM